MAQYRALITGVINRLALDAAFPIKPKAVVDTANAILRVEGQVTRGHWTTRSFQA